jgi:hypothetical protein
MIRKPSKKKQTGVFFKLHKQSLAKMSLPFDKTALKAEKLKNAKCGYFLTAPLQAFEEEISVMLFRYAVS